MKNKGFGFTKQILISYFIIVQTKISRYKIIIITRERVYFLMTYQPKSFLQTLQSMHQPITKLERELQRSRMLTHDITIDNKTDKRMDLVISVQDQLDKFQISKSSSRVSLPQHSSYTHRISNSRLTGDGKARRQTKYINNKFLQDSQQRFRASPLTVSQNINADKIRQHTSREREQQSFVRLQKSFQPLSRMPIHNKQSIRRFQKQQLTQSGVRFDNCSQVSSYSQVKSQRQPAIQPLAQQDRKTAFFETPKYKTQAQNFQNTIQSTVKKTDQEDYLKIKLPVSDFQNKINKVLSRFENSQNNDSQEHQIKHEHQDILIQQQPFNITFNQFYADGKVETQKKKNIYPKVEPSTLRYQNTKLYSQTSRQRKKFKIAKQKQRQYKFNLNTSGNTRFLASQQRERRKNKFQIEKFQVQNKKNQKEIYHIRKAQISPSKYLFISQFTYNNISIKEKQKHSISRKALQISERLYSRSKEKIQPCEHCRRFSESVQRERFKQLLRENNFIRKKLTNQEQQKLFQSLRRQNDSMSAWSKKVLNYTYSEYQKI